MNRFDEQRALLLWSGVSLRRRRILPSGNLTKRMLAVIAAGLVTRKRFEVRAVCHLREVHKKRTPQLCKSFVVFTALALPAVTHLSAVAQTCPDNVPHITGTWTVLPYQMPINPISANLLTDGK